MDEALWEAFADLDDEKRVLKEEIAHIRTILKALTANPTKVQALCFYIMVEDGRIIGGESHENILTLEHGRVDAVDFLVDYAKQNIEAAIQLV